ncbi:uncharacterized protein LOC120216350 [Hibiscus syriacus]|uniref:uncharacterized protein LOC120216350 n=1 Tax=Hibiscus syriacus TaxID=106335 RepID=UPI001920826C|nr:uncharacterized protein LOC120216350 [Hibiscus syriacus]
MKPKAFKMSPTLRLPRLQRRFLSTPVKKTQTKGATRKRGLRVGTFARERRKKLAGEVAGSLGQLRRVAATLGLMNLESQCVGSTLGCFWNTCWSRLMEEEIRVFPTHKCVGLTWFRPVGFDLRGL